jgi:hypothetical protein
MSNVTWNSINTTWLNTLLVYEPSVPPLPPTPPSPLLPKMNDLLRIYPKSELNDYFSTQVGDTNKFEKSAVASVILLLTSLLETNALNKLISDIVETNDLKLPQASLNDIATTTGTTITADKTILLTINGVTYKVLAEEV